MQIGILGVGNIGATLTGRLSDSGHHVKVANSRGPSTIPDEVTSAGGRPVEARDVVAGVDALIMSIPLSRIPGVRGLLDDLPDSAVVLDTSNYYPQRDGHIASLDDGQVESLWVSEQIGGRPVVKAWNAIGAGSFATKATAAGTPDRIAIPVAADADTDRALGMSLVSDTGFDGFDAGALPTSWRQQPGTPAYCTDLTGPQLAAALDRADAARSPRRRDLALTVMTELSREPAADRDPDFWLHLTRMLSS